MTWPCAATTARERMWMRKVVSTCPRRGTTLICTGRGWKDGRCSRTFGGPGSSFLGEEPPQPLSRTSAASESRLTAEERTQAVDEAAPLAARAVRAAAATALVRASSGQPLKEALVLLPCHAPPLPGAGGAHASGAVQAAIRDQLRELHGVRRRALAQVVAHDEEVEAALVRGIAPYPPDQHLVAPRRLDSERVQTVG